MPFSAQTLPICWLGAETSSSRSAVSNVFLGVECGAEWPRLGLGWAFARLSCCFPHTLAMTQWSFLALQTGANGFTGWRLLTCSRLRKARSHCSEGSGNPMECPYFMEICWGMARALEKTLTSNTRPLTLTFGHQGELLSGLLNCLGLDFGTTVDGSLVLLGPAARRLREDNIRRAALQTNFFPFSPPSLQFWKQVWSHQKIEDI